MTKVNKLSFKYVIPAIVSDLEANIAPCLLGAPGIGKSSIIERLGETLNTKVFKVACNQLATKEDLTGSRIVERKDVDSDNIAEKYTQIMFPQTNIAEAITYAKEHPNETPILYLDEINRVSDDVTSACLSLITDRRMGNVKLPDNLRMISAGNDEGNVTALDTASITRFSIYHVSADQNEWLESQPDLNVFVRETVEDSITDFIGDESGYGYTDDDSINAGYGDDDDYSSENIDLDEYDEHISQMAVPRTITFTSNWLNHLGFTSLNINEMDADKLNTIKPLVQSSSERDNNIFYQLIVAHSGDTPFSKSLFKKIEDAIEASETTTMTTDENENLNTVIPSANKEKSVDLIAQFWKNPSLDDAVELVKTTAKEDPEFVVNFFDNAFYNTFEDAIYEANDASIDRKQYREMVLLVFNNLSIDGIIDKDDFLRQENIYLTHYAASVNEDDAVYNALRSSEIKNTFINNIVELNNAVHAVSI